jgi:hypothetical protein
MKETFEDYLQRLKDRRTEDDYKYTDEDFIQYQEYIRDCWLTNLSVYKCLEFMYFAERDMDDQLFNRETKQETEVNDFINKLMYRIKVLRTGIENALVLNDINELKKILSKSLEDVPTTSDGKWQKIKQEQHNFLPGFIKQFEEGGEYQELTNKDWSVSQFLKWLKSNNFKIIK